METPFKAPSKQLTFLYVGGSDLLINYIDRINSDEFYNKVISSKAFRRLNAISFLGAIDYLPDYKHIKHAAKTRAQHSISVAALALMVSEKRKYSPELTRHLVVAGLLHDIGHPPLSHSIEPYLKARFGYGHHEMGEMVLLGEVKLGKPLCDLLRTKLDVHFIAQLVNGAAGNEAGGDLFASKINLDTIDGIIRSSGYLNKDCYSLSPVSVALASFVTEGENSTRILDTFWNLKDKVYNNLITTGDGLLADLVSQEAFSSGALHLSEDFLFRCEKSWQQKYSKVFLAIRNVGVSCSKRPTRDTPIEYIKRKYTVCDGEVGMERRYSHTKERSVFDWRLGAK